MCLCYGLTVLKQAGWSPPPHSHYFVCRRHCPPILWIFQTRTMLYYLVYEGVSKSFRTGRLKPELQLVKLSATRCSCIAILWVSLVSSTATTLCVASQRVIQKLSVYFIIDSVRKLLDTPSYNRNILNVIVTQLLEPLQMFTSILNLFIIWMSRVITEWWETLKFFPLHFWE
jgi:hypothetical protein